MRQYVKNKLSSVDKLSEINRRAKSRASRTATHESKGFLRVFEGMGRVVGGIFVSLLFAAFILTTIVDIAPNSSLIDQIMVSAEDTLKQVGQLVILGVVMLLAKIYRDRQRA